MPFIAGVIGRHKFIYDLWGDTVNTASPMESQGVPGAIQVSEATRLLLGGGFAFEDRGDIEVKGQGRRRAYLLVGPAPDMSRAEPSGVREPVHQESAATGVKPAV